MSKSSDNGLGQAFDQLGSIVKAFSEKRDSMLNELPPEERAKAVKFELDYARIHKDSGVAAAESFKAKYIEENKSK